jgi:hypothetical protein
MPIRPQDLPNDMTMRLVRGLGSSTVALLGVSRPKGTDFLELAGTGTLAHIGNRYGILTASHVWDEVLCKVAKVGITLTDNINHQHLMDVQTIIPTVLPKGPGKWDERGPDLAFLRIPNERVGAIQAFCVFEDLKPPPKTIPPCLEGWVAMGAPKELGTFTETHASIELRGENVSPTYLSGDPDYYEFEVDTNPTGMPKDFGGFSGGGLWRVLIYENPSTGKIDWVHRLKGVIFWQYAPVDGRRTIRCHGPESIAALIARVLETGGGGSKS